MSTQPTVSMDTLVSLCKRRGIVFPNSEIYGGFGSTWDYGPLGVELKNNIKRAWWRDMVWARPDVVGLDGAILSAPDVWQGIGSCRALHRCARRVPLVPSAVQGRRPWHQLPPLRRQRLHGHAAVQYDVQDVCRAGRG